jgi:hypothetical protein
LVSCYNTSFLDVFVHYCSNRVRRPDLFVIFAGRSFADPVMSPQECHHVATSNRRYHFEGTFLIAWPGTTFVADNHTSSPVIVTMLSSSARQSPLFP